MVSRVSPVDFENLRVLIVDDNNFVRKLERSMLRQLGVQTIAEAGDGADALKRLSARDCDLILLDWKMPRFSGEEFLKVLRNGDDTYSKEIPILVITGLANQSLVLKAVHLGADGVIVKPFSISLLKHRIEAVMLMQKRDGSAVDPVVDETESAQRTETIVFDIDAIL